MSDLKLLAQILKSKNELDNKIALLIGRPAMIGHVGEFIAADIFNIELFTSGTNKGCDGKFTKRELIGKTVNVKWYSKHTGLLDITPNHLPDYYLILTGPQSPAISSRGTSSPWLIHNVFLFESVNLVTILQSRNVKIGVATSIIKILWEQASIYPIENNKILRLTTEQRDKLSYFR